MFRLSINALDKNIFDGEVKSLTLPGVDGELTILENHIPLITPLKEGKVSFSAEKKSESISIKGGVLEVSPKKVIVLIEV
jgi:F-type H+-transporting ATPase subunit epsilon